MGIYDSLTTVLDSATNSSLSQNHKSITTTSSLASNTCNTTDCDISHKETNAERQEQAKPPLDAYLSRLEKYAAKQNENKSVRKSQEREEFAVTPSNSGSCSSSLRGSLESVSSTNGSLSKHRSNIRNLSPNVQRIITHSDAEAVDAVDIEALQYQNRASTPIQQQQIHLQHRFIKKSSSAGHCCNSQHKAKLSHIPLSKITGKLAQTGTDLVETFNNVLNEHSENSLSRFEYKSKSLRNSFMDDDKTPTNTIPFNFDCLAGVAGLGPRQLSLNRCDYENEKDCLQNDTNMSLECLNTDNSVSEAINFAVVSQNLKNLTLAVNSKDFLTPSGDQDLIKPLHSTVISTNNNKQNGTQQHPLSYARSKSLAARDFSQKNINVVSLKHTNTLPRSQFLKDEELDENQISAESLDRLSDIKSKFSPKETRKLSTLMLPDIAKLKHRPLSSSSICSTSSSSSSSSGTDHINGKLNTSYLASIESLADEHDLTDPHSGMTVFERACMEIVDSERSYVNDLGEVIRGLVYNNFFLF